MPNAILQLSGHVHVAGDTDTLFDDLANAMTGAAARAIEQRGVFHVALSGGGTPAPFYQRLVIDPRYRVFPWPNTHVWIVDERRVPEDDDRSNVKMIRETLTDHVPMKARQLHPMPVLNDDPAGDYEAALREVFASADMPQLDFVLLGMGDDAHTASLFPGSPAQSINDRWIATNEGEQVTPPPRVTMTYPLLNAARELAILATGAKKAATISRVAQQLRTGEPDIANLPITGINPIDGELTWYLDKDAANAK